MPEELEVELEDDTVEHVTDMIRLAVQVFALAVGLWEMWVVVVPESTKIDLRAWWATFTKSGEQSSWGAKEIHRSLIDIEVASESELAAAVERLPRVA